MLQIAHFLNACYDFSNVHLKKGVNTMARRIISNMDVQEVLYQHSQGRTIKEIVRSLGVSRNTVRRLTRQQSIGKFPETKLLREIEEGVSTTSADPMDQSVKGVIQEKIHSYHDIIEEMLNKPYMTGRQVHRLLAELYQFNVSQRSLYRYMAAHCASYKEYAAKPRITVHLTTIAGQQAQVDFGYVGLMTDPKSGKQRKAYAFAMILSHSRHRFIYFVFHQDQQTWVDCHRRAFEFFGGVPKTIILDNLKAGVIAPHIYDPRMNRYYAECERYYGFIADPALVETPRHKGKIERSIPILRQQILAGRTFADIMEANDRAQKWSRDEIGQEISRPTGKKPYLVFCEEEKEHLLPLPHEPFSCGVWKEVLVQRDCHIVFLGSYYSVSCVFVGQKVWVYADDRMVRISVDNTIVKRHTRSYEKGTWVTDVTDYPEHTRDILMKTISDYRDEAQAIGVATARVVETLLTPHSWRQCRKVRAILRLAKAHDSIVFEKACARLIAFNVFEYQALENILTHTDIRESTPKKSPLQWIRSMSSFRFVRNPNEFKPI